MANNRKLARWIAGGFFVFWLVILYAGADHPPPPGFLVLIVFDIGCSVVIYFRVSTYIDWLKSQKTKRLFRAISDGLVTGAVIALITLLLPVGGEPSTSPPGLFEHLIWFLVHV